MASQVSDHLEPWQNLRGKVVLVTGASSGLGREFCLDLAKAGCRVVAAARRFDRLKSICDEINQRASSEVDARGLRAVAVELDVCADGLTIEKSVQKAWDSFGHIDSLINNAGIRGNVKSALKLTEEEWDHVFRTNLTGSWLVAKYVCKHMCDANRKGSVINISSTSGLNRGHLPGAAAYASSKAGLIALTKILSLGMEMMPDDQFPRQVKLKVGVNEFSILCEIRDENILLIEGWKEFLGKLCLGLGTGLWMEYDSVDSYKVQKNLLIFLA